MLILRSIINKSCYKNLPKSIKRFAFYGSAITSTGLVSWCTCQATENLKVTGVTEDRSLKNIQKWIQAEYEQRVLHSSIARFGRAAVTVVSVVIDYKYSLLGIDEKSERYPKLKSECHIRSAVKFKRLCSKNGGVFIKVGQHIGSLEFLFPLEYTDTLKCFQYEAPESCIDDVKYVIESDTKVKMTELFQSFNEKPIGSASLAQVHKAVLKNGDIVAVKIQHRTVKEHAFADSKVIEFFANVAAKIFPEFQFQWLVDQLKVNLPLELDFINEGKNCEKMADILKDFKYLKVPEIYWKQSTARVLFMEHCNGGIVDDIEYIRENNLSVNEISTKLGRLYSEMIFVHGFIHCDPHPGNILVCKNEDGKSTDLILLDHGLYTTMPDKTRLDYCKLWQSMIQADIDGIKKYSTALGVGNYYGLFACIVTGRSWDSIQGGINKKSMSAKELKEVQENALKFVSTITEVLELIPREMILIFKTNDLLRGLDARLKTKATSASFITMAECCLKAVYNDDISKCDSIYSKWRVRCTYAINSFRLMAYEFSLTPLGSVFLTILNTFTNSVYSMTSLFPSF